MKSQRTVSYFIFIFYIGVSISFTKGQDDEGELPSVIDPFPIEPGPEPEPTTAEPYTGCPAECAAGFENSMNKTGDFGGLLTALNSTINARLNSVAAGGGGSSGGDGSAPEDLSAKLSSIEDQWNENITVLSGQLTTDIDGTTTSLQEQMAGVRTEINNQLEAFGGGGGGGDGESFSFPTLYNNITGVLDQLETTKLSRVEKDFAFWRKNFDAINKIFAKMKKSQYNNNVVVVG